MEGLHLFPGDSGKRVVRGHVTRLVVGLGVGMRPRTTFPFSVVAGVVDGQRRGCLRASFALTTSCNSLSVPMPLRLRVYLPVSPSTSLSLFLSVCLSIYVPATTPVFSYVAPPQPSRPSHLPLSCTPQPFASTESGHTCLILRRSASPGEAGTSGGWTGPCPSNAGKPLSR